MLGMFSVGLKSLSLLAIVALCIVAALVSQLDEGNQLRQTTHIPHIPVRKQDHHPQTQSLGAEHPQAASQPSTSSSTSSDSRIWKDPGPTVDYKGERKERHPIDHLVDQGQADYDNILRKQTSGVDAAAAAYRKRRKRQPPPKFDEWVKYAEEHNAVMVEDFFDQIYHDLDPFWAIPAHDIRDAARAWKCFVSVRDGNVTYHADEERPWMTLWTDMITQIGEHLPDMDVAINEMDESRVMVPWEIINSHLELANLRYSKFPKKKESQVLDFPPRYNKTYDKALFPDHGFHTLGYLWSLAQEACDPDSQGRIAQWDEVNYMMRVQFPRGHPDGSYEGYVANWTHAKDPCTHAHIREMHGSFVEPLSMSTTTKLVPMFGGSKLPMNNDILLPAAMYWTDDPFYKGSEKRVPWEEKQTSMIWRGAASGGRNKQTNWRRFHRHRFVGMVNGTQVHAQELLNAQLDHKDLIIDVGDADSKTPHHFPLPRQNDYDIQAQLDGRLGPWTDSFTDAKFAHLLCFPAEPHNGPSCSYTSPYFETAPHTPMEDQYHFKYLPDIDGNSFSGRYRGFLRSFSLPIKATIYSEWHDSRLFAWKHFVPMDNTFVDFYGIMEYFLGYEPSGASGADEQLRRAHSLELNSSSPSAWSRSDPANGPTHEAALTRDEPTQGAPIPKRQAQDQIKQAQKRYPHDNTARAIAEAGHIWAEKVLRREDMLIYTYRLLLEYARLAADSRERMGWTGDGIVVGVNDQRDAALLGATKDDGQLHSAGRVEGAMRKVPQVAKRSLERLGETWRKARRRVSE